jgi:hypothetical protein
VDTIGFGPSREPRRGWHGWRPRHGWPGRWVWLVVAGAAAVAVAAVVLVTTGGHARRVTSAPVPPAPSLLPLLGGVRAQGARADLFLGGANLWRVIRQPQAVATGLLFNGLSPLLPPGHSAVADQLAPVPGGVVAHISDTSTGVTYGAPGRVVFIPAGGTAARVIARATVIAVSPDGRQVWVQTAIQSVGNGDGGVPPGFTSPTWAVNLAGQRVSPVLQLPLGLVAATGSGPLTQNLSTGQLQLWNGSTGQPIPMNLPADAQFVAAGPDRAIWASCAASCVLHVADLDTGTGTATALPPNWMPASETYPPPPASFGPSDQQFVLPLDRVDSSGNTTAQALFIADTATRTLRMIPGTLPTSLAASQPIQLTGSWDRHGLLWVLASNPDTDYYQLGYWTGTGPLHTLAPAQGSPVALSAPGSG